MNEIELNKLFSETSKINDIDDSLIFDDLDLASLDHNEQEISDLDKLDQLIKRICD